MLQWVWQSVILLLQILQNTLKTGHLIECAEGELLHEMEEDVLKGVEVESSQHLFVADGHQVDLASPVLVGPALAES